MDKISITGNVIAVQRSEKYVVIVIVTGGEFPKPLPIKFFGKNLDKVGSARENIEATIEFYPSGNEYQGKYYAEFVGSTFTQKSAPATAKQTQAPAQNQTQSPEQQIKACTTLDELKSVWAAIAAKTPELAKIKDAQKKAIESDDDDLPF